MYVSNLRKVGGSVMLTLPPALLEMLNLRAGAAVNLDVKDGCLTVAAQAQPRYTLAELLAASDYSQPMSAEDQEWQNAPSVGKEII